MTVVQVREAAMPSGAILKVRPAPFAEARALYQALLMELRRVEIKMDNLESENFIKDLFCIGFSSPEISAALEKCLERCQYDTGTGPKKIDKDTFESPDTWQDYLTVCMEVAKENTLPFMKSLFATFSQLSPTKKKNRA